MTLDAGSLWREAHADDAEAPGREVRTSQEDLSARHNIYYFALGSFSRLREYLTVNSHEHRRRRGEI